MNLPRTLTVLALAVVGAFFLLVSSLGGYASGFAYEGTLLSFITTLSMLSLLGAAVVALRSFKASDMDPRKLGRIYAVVYLGLFLAFAAQFIPFPVGCNLDAWPYNLTNVHHGCPASPEGAWSTIWPNVLSTCL